MVLGLFRKKELKYRIDCGYCGWIRLSYESPSGGFTCKYNSASFCPKCGKCGGSVGPYNGEKIEQYSGDRLKEHLKFNKKMRKKMIEENSKLSNVNPYLILKKLDKLMEEEK